MVTRCLNAGRCLGKGRPLSFWIRCISAQDVRVRPNVYTVNAEFASGYERHLLPPVCGRSQAASLDGHPKNGRFRPVFHRTTITLQYSDAGVRGVQLNTLAPAKGPSSTGKVKVSAARTRVPEGNTEISVETDALFALYTKQTSVPLLLKLGMILVRTFDKTLVFLTDASAELLRANVVASANAEIPKPNILDISSSQEQACLSILRDKSAHNI